MKLWAGRFQKETDTLVNDFNSSIQFDARLYKQDIAGSIAHAQMLGKQGIIEEHEVEQIVEGLKAILADIEADKVEFSVDNEDIHMNIETLLTQRIGDAGKRLHTARSRNDQVAVDTRLYVKEEIPVIVGMLLNLEKALIRQAEGNLDAIAAGTKPVLTYRTPYRPYRRHPKYKGFLALYVHYLYLLGKVQQRQYPPRMTPHLRQEIMKFERYKEQFAFLREQNIATPEQLAAFQAHTEETLATLTKRRTILNVRKKRRWELYSALADEATLEPVQACFEMGLPGMEEELARYQAAKEILDHCPIPRERLTEEKAALYQQLAEVNREIRATRKQLELCKAILYNSPQMERDIQAAEGRLEKPEQKLEHHKEDLGIR